MKVRVAYTVDVDDVIREEINQWYGREGLATREEVRHWYEANGHSMDDDLSYNSQLRAKRAREEAKR